MSLLPAVVWQNGKGCQQDYWGPPQTARARAQHGLQAMREDHLRPINPTPYKLSVSPALYEELHELLAKEATV